jgi:hypothetical protein
MSRPFSKSLLAAAIALGGLTGMAQADVILSFTQLPNTNTPEFQFGVKPGDTNPSFYETTGAIGNGDGNQPTATQTEGGLQLTFANSLGLGITPLPGLGQDPGNGNILYDASLHFTGFTANTNAVAAGSTYIQALSSGAFEIWSTKAFGVGSEVLLLSGTATNAVITGAANSGTGSTFSTHVTYTGGLLVDTLGIIDAGTAGQFSFTDLSINPALHLDNGKLAAFTASGTGSFSADTTTGPGNPVPLPAAAWGGMGLLGLLGGIQALRRRSIRQA